MLANENPDLSDILSEKVHEVSGCSSVGPERRAHHVTSSVTPALVPVVGTIRAQAGSDRFSENDAASSSCVGNYLGAAFAHHVDDVYWTVDLRTLLAQYSTNQG